jgi:cystathionine beta-synthase
LRDIYKSMNYHDNILTTIGNTPLVKLNKIVADIPATVLAKLETFNPGHSIKDRMALKMINDAEERGDLKPGGTIIECTSGNTGMGIAITAAIRGYKCIFTTNDKQSKEKIDMLKALGGEVVVCPTSVGPDDPRSYYSVAAKLNAQIANSYWCNQYDNPSNAVAHFESTGPEIWQQTDGKITHLVVGVGTGGTISGTSRFLKSKNPNIKVWGIDTFGSVFKKYHETGEFDEKEIYPYITEGIGEDILPKNVDFSVIDHFEKVSDKDGAVTARNLARQEGMLLGYSAGSAVAGLLQMKDKLTKDDVVVVIMHDHGSRYVGKIYNDDWMRERGFLDEEMTVQDVLRNLKAQEMMTASPDDSVRSVFDLMRDHDLSQLPITKGDEIVGSITETAILSYLLENPLRNSEKLVGEFMGKPFPEVVENLPFSKLNSYFSKTTPAVITRDAMGKRYILTKYDIIQMI